MASSASCQRVDLALGRKTTERLLGELQRAIDGNLEHAAARADEFDIGIDKLAQSCPRTEGLRLVASSAAIVDGDLHDSLFRDEVKPRGHASRRGLGTRSGQLI